MCECTTLALEAFIHRRLLDHPMDPPCTAKSCSSVVQRELNLVLACRTKSDFGLQIGDCDRCPPPSTNPEHTGRGTAAHLGGPQRINAAFQGLSQAAVGLLHALHLEKGQGQALQLPTWGTLGPTFCTSRGQPGTPLRCRNTKVLAPQPHLAFEGDELRIEATEGEVGQVGTSGHCREALGAQVHALRGAPPSPKRVVAVLGTLRLLLPGAWAGIQGPRRQRLQCGRRVAWHRSVQDRARGGQGGGCRGSLSPLSWGPRRPARPH